MAEIIIPFPFSDLPIKPELTGRVRVSDTITQTLATLLSWDGEARRMIRASRSGSLHAVSPQFAGINRQTSVGGNETFVFPDIPTTEVIIRGHPTNGEAIWVHCSEAPSATNGYPVGATESLQISIDNLNKLRIFVVTTGNKCIVLYTR